MNIIDSLIVDSIFLLVPYLVYFITATNDNIVEKKNEQINLEFAIYASFYLLIMFGYDSAAPTPVLLLSIPILIGYIYDKKKISIILSVIVCLYIILLFHINILILLFGYIICFILSYVIKNKKIYIIEFIVIQSIIYIIYMYPLHYIIITEIILLYIILIKLNIISINYVNNLSSFYMTLKQIERDKQVERSLFRISHEIKNPLAVCKGYFELMDGSLKKYKKYMPVIREEINHSLMILDDFRTIGKIEYCFEQMDIVCLLDEVVDNYKEFIKCCDITMAYDFTDEEVMIQGDYTRLKQVLINIIKNSIEAVVNKNNARIDIIKYIDGDDFVIEIIDNGIGISEDNLSKLGQAFFTTKDNGTGLGVYFSKEVLEAHNGSINYFSNTKRGTAVQLRIKK